MSNPISNYYAETSINGEVIGEQEISLFPLVNSVLTSEPLIFNVSKLPIPISQSYQLVYENNELGSVIDTSRYYRNEILSLNVVFVSQSAASVYSSSYQLVYDNSELGPVIDKSRYYRNEILTLNNDNRYRYLVQDSTGSNYPIDGRFDQYYNYTKVILNFDSLTNQAFTNLSVLSSGSFQINDGPTPDTSSYVTNSIEFITIGAGGGAGGPDGGSNACGGGSGALISGSINSIFSGSQFNIYVGGGGGGGTGCVAGTGGGSAGSNGGGSGGNAGSSGCSGGGGGGGGWSGIVSSSNYIIVTGGGSGGGGANEGGANDSPSAGGGVQNNGANGTSLSGGNGDAFSGDGGGWAGGGGGYYGGAKQNTSTGANSGGGNYTGSTSFNVFVSTGSGVGQGSTAGTRTYNWAGLTGTYGGGGAPIIGSSGTAGSGGNGVVSIRYLGSQKANGGTITTTGSYTVHTFTGSATMSFYDSPYLAPTSIGYGYFNGSGSFLRITGSPLLNLGSGSVFESPFTVEYDFYTNSSSKYQTILSRGGGTANYNTSSGLVYNAGISESKVIWEYRTNNTSSYILTGSTNILNSNWYSYAVTYDGNITRLYLNGTLENYVCGSVYNYPSTLTSSLTSSFIGRLVSTGSNDFSGYLDKFRITTGLARYTSTSYITQSSNYPIGSGFLSGSNYCNSNILNIRFVSGSISASNLILPAGTTNLTSSQDILITNITGTLDNSRINTISTGSNLIKRNDGIVDKTVYTGDLYLSSTNIVTVGSINNLINNLDSGSNLIRRSDGITSNTFYNGDLYFSETTIETKGLIERIILRGSDTSITVNSSEFIPSVNKTINFEADYNYMFDNEIDSIYIIDSAFGLPTGFTIRERNIVGYVNFTTTKTIVVKLSDNTYYNVIIKPIFTKKKYIY